MEADFTQSSASVGLTLIALNRISPTTALEAASKRTHITFGPHSLFLSFLRVLPLWQTLGLIFLTKYHRLDCFREPLGAPQWYSLLWYRKHCRGPGT